MSGKLFLHSFEMYSNPHAVGPIASLEYPTCAIVDEYFEKHPNIASENEDDVIEEIYQHVLDELNIGYLRNIIEWRLDNLIDGTAEPL